MGQFYYAVVNKCVKQLPAVDKVVHKLTLFHCRTRRVCLYCITVSTNLTEQISRRF